MSGQTDLVKQVIAARKAALHQQKSAAVKVDRKNIKRPPKKKKEEPVEEVVVAKPQEPVQVVNTAKKKPKPKTKPIRRTKKSVEKPVEKKPVVEPAVKLIGGKPKINILRHVVRDVLSDDYQRVSVGDDRISLTNPKEETNVDSLNEKLSALFEGIISIRGVESVRTGELNPDKQYRVYFNVV